MSADLSNLARHLMSQTPEGPSAAHDLPHLLTAKTAAAEEQFALAAVEFYSQQKLGRAEKKAAAKLRKEQQQAGAPDTAALANAAANASDASIARSSR